MKPLEEYLVDLLYEHDLVIVPGFGAFIGRRHPARVDRSKGIFKPPYKELTFNKKIFQNDGLLINRIAHAEQIDYRDASAYVDRAVAEWKDILRRHHYLRLKDIGHFHLLDEKLLFTPAPTKNFLGEAFGLYGFYRTPRVQTYEIKPLSNPIPPKPGGAEEKPSVPSRGSETGRPAPHAVRWLRYAAALALFILFLWGGFKYRHLLVDQQVQVQTAGYSLPVRFPEIIIPAGEIKKQVTPVYSYYIIIGAFGDENNARKLVRTLREEGIGASIVDRNEKGLYYVAYGRYTSEVEGESALAEVRRRFRGAWLWKTAETASP